MKFGILTNEWSVNSFRLSNLTEMKKRGLFINDLSLHDSSRELVLAGTQQSVEMKIALSQASCSIFNISSWLHLSIIYNYYVDVELKMFNLLKYYQTRNGHISIRIFRSNVLFEKKWIFLSKRHFIFLQLTPTCSWKKSSKNYESRLLRILTV